MSKWWEATEFRGFSDELLKRMADAQDALSWIEAASGQDLVREACTNLAVDNSVADLVPDGDSALVFGNRTHADLVALFSPRFPSGTSLAEDLADEVHLCRAFAEPEKVLAAVKDKVMAAVKHFPRGASGIKVGDNKGDVLDPFILAANFELLSGGSLARTVETTVSHKVLMKIEGMVGGLHEATLGAMRGNFRIPEPGKTAGGTKDIIHPAFNPFPGADIGQVPVPASPATLRLFQCKNKTGSAKGGDGVRLGQQLRRLEQTYGASTFYAAIVGNTLHGHRSMGAVLRESPNTAVLVGDAALEELARSPQGAELLLRTYRRAFRAASQESGFDFEQVASAAITTFEAEAVATGGDLVEAWLSQAMGGPRKDQDSRLR